MIIKKQIISMKSLLLGASLALTSCLHSTPNETDFDEVALRSAIMLQNVHYYKPEFDKKLSSRVFDLFLKRLDASKIYFTQADVDEFSTKYRESLTDLIIKKECIKAANDMFDRLVVRAKKREKEVKTLLTKNDFTFDSERYIYRDRENVSWAESEEELAGIWYNRVESILLSEELRRSNITKLAVEQGKANPLEKERSAIDRVKLKFKRDFNALFGLDREDVANMMISALANSFGPHTDYLSARQMEDFKTNISMKLVGVGAVLQTDDDGATKISGIVINGPTDKHGEIQLNDRIIGVDSLNDGNMTDIIYMPISKVVSLIRGAEGTQVKLKIEPAKNPAEIKEIVIKRAPVELKNDKASAQLIELTKDGDKQKLGVIKLPSFYSDFDDKNGAHCYRDVKKLLTRLIAEDMDGLLIDLRNNGGGSLDEVIKMTGLFIGEGPVVSVYSSRGGSKQYGSDAPKALYNGPLVISIDKSSASASEILAGALQDYNRAIIVGDSSTFGKGTVQQHLDLKPWLPSNSSRARAGFLKPTIQKFYRVAGSSTQLKGVESDIVIPSIYEGIEVGERYLDYALKHDVIKAAQGFKPWERHKLNLAALKANSAKRINNSIDFAYMKEDYNRFLENKEENKISLNKVIREKKLEEGETRLKSRNKERILRFLEIQKEDVKTMNVYRLELDDLKSDTLIKLDLTDIKDTYLRTEKSDLEDLDQTPEWPSQMNAQRREELSILSDLIKHSTVSATAKVGQ